MHYFNINSPKVKYFSFQNPGEYVMFSEHKLWHRSDIISICWKALKVQMYTLMYAGIKNVMLLREATNMYVGMSMTKVKDNAKFPMNYFATVKKCSRILLLTCEMDKIKPILAND